VIVNRKTGRLVDGHLRVQLAVDAGEKQIPVCFVELEEAEEALVLASIDPLSAMAGIDLERFEELLTKADIDTVDLRDMIDSVLRQAGEQAEQEQDEEDQSPGEHPGIEIEPFEHYDYVLVLADNVNDWNNLCDRLGLERVDVSRVHGKQRIGLGRCVRASRLLELLGDAQ
jgi:hypothetical protein